MTYIIKLLGAIAIFVVGKWLSRKFADFTETLLTKSKVDETLKKFLGNVVYVLLLILVILVALGTLGIQTTSFVAVLGAATLAIGLALQSNLSNFGAGVMILSSGLSRWVMWWKQVVPWVLLKISEYLM